MIFQYNNTNIHYQVSGSGPTLVLIHGFLETSLIWKEITQELNPDKQLITIDLPGHGKSDCLTEEHSMENFSALLFSLLKFLQIKKYTLLGHSMGGYVALAMAEKQSENIQNLILLNSTPTPDNRERMKNRNRAIALIKTYKESFINMAISNLFNETAKLQFSNEIKTLKNEALLFSEEGIRKLILGMRDRKDRTEILKNFKQRKLLICGKQDSIIPIESSIEISETTKTKLVKLDGGHMSWLENKSEIVKILHLID